MYPTDDVPEPRVKALGVKSSVRVVQLYFSMSRVAHDVIEGGLQSAFEVILR